MINVQEYLEGRATKEKTEHRMNIQIFTDPVCLKELTLNIETIPQNINFPSNDDYCKYLSRLRINAREKLTIFYDAKNSFFINKDYKNVKVVNDFISQAKIYEKEVADLLDRYTSHHKQITENKFDD